MPSFGHMIRLRLILTRTFFLLFILINCMTVIGQESIDRCLLLEHDLYQEKIEIQEGSFLRIRMNNGERHSGIFAIENDSILGLDGKEIYLEEVSFIKVSNEQQKKAGSIVKKTGIGIMTIGLVAIPTGIILDAIYGGYIVSDGAVVAGVGVLTAIFGSGVVLAGLKTEKTFKKYKRAIGWEFKIADC